MSERDDRRQNHVGDRGRQMTWIDCKDFRESIGTLELVVRVSRSDEYVPKYSIRIGRHRADGNLVGSNVPIYARGKGRIDITRVGAVLAKLVKEAEDYVHNEVQHREDEVIEDKLKKETRGMQKNEQPKGLGALGKMDAEKRKEKSASPEEPK